MRWGAVKVAVKEKVAEMAVVVRLRDVIGEVRDALDSCGCEFDEDTDEMAVGR